MFAIRVFIAVEISDELRARLTNAVSRLKESNARVRWVPAENMHISIAFIGNIFEDKIDDIKNVIDETLDGQDPFTAEISELGTFGKKHAPRVIWAGVQDARELDDIYAKLKEGLAKIDIKIEDRSFKPHITLGRVKAYPKGCELVDLIESGKDESFGELPISSLKLMKSELSANGSVYSVLHDVEF